ncbi:MAG: M56 family metallopeptidase [Lachnospiraceae bacterium]|nr:M56 family metallopeptidase [Lachnospiraceae bacterium]
MTLLEMSFSGAVFIIAVVMIRTIAINSLPKKTFVILWEMVLLRLIIPFTIPSAFSIYTIIDNRISTPALSGAKTDTIASALSREHFAMMQDTERLTTTITPSSIWPVVWCVGAILFTAFFTISYLRCRIEFRTALPVNNPYIEQWIKEHPHKRRISIRQSDRISTPLTYGILKPVILMPKETDWKNIEQLRYILSHEYVHICRYDTVTKLIATYALCIHWFNPFVWTMYILFNRDIELACDESVIRRSGDKAKSVYSLMLISMEAKKSGLSTLCNHFNKNAVEERITAIMRTKRTTTATLLSAGLVILVTVSLFATSAIVAADNKTGDAPAVNALDTSTTGPAADKKAMTIIHETADILHYEDGAPYIHDILTNNTDNTIIETQYCMLAYNESGSPLKLHWNFLDSNAESSFENIVRTKTKISSGQTEEYRGGWSLYDGEIMKDLPKVGNGEANQVAYSLLCLKQVDFEDGTVWNNPNYENWFKTYAGKETAIEELQNYYPHEYKVVAD